MTGVLAQLEAARAEVARLEGIAAGAPCLEVGHDWQHIGGANCGCPDGQCSVPVFTCSRCGDSDYGHNSDAETVREECAQRD